MTEESLPRIILRLVQNKEDTRLEGGESLLPVDEAILAACKQYFSDREILSILTLERDLRKALASDAIMDYVPADKKQQLKSFLFSSQKSPRFDDAITQAVLYIAGEKRMLNGMVLKPVSELEKKVRGSVVDIIQSEFPKGVYVVSEKIANAEAKFKKRQKMKKVAILAGSLLLGGLGIFGNYSIRDKVETVRSYNGQLEELEKTLKEKKAQIAEREAYLDSINRGVSEKQNYLLSLEKKKE